MTDQAQLEILENNPIGKGLDAFRTSFNSLCENKSILCTPDALDQLAREDIQNLTLDLLTALRNLPVIRLLRSKTSHGTLHGDFPKLLSAVGSGDFHFDRIKPLLTAALTDNRDDALIWDQVYNAVTESTPPPQPIPSSSQQTPWMRNTSSFVNSSELRKHVDAVLKEELGPMYVGLSNFHETFLGGVADLETASKAVFKKCSEGRNPLYRKGWSGWPEDANQDDVLNWFADLCGQLAEFAGDHKPKATRLKPLAQPNKPVQGSTAERKLDIGFVSNSQAGKDSRCHWRHILIPGELKSNPSADIASMTWLDLGRYAREVLAAQDTRRFVLGFTLCGSLMRIWEFDRLGGIASERFDINKDGLQFVSTILAFLWMNEEQLGFDPTVITENGQRFIEIQRNGSTERLIIDGLIMRARCISGRATTCWKAHREGDLQTPLVIKDSWQYTEREEEGELLREATEKGVVNVARYYHHEIVRVLGTDDDVQSNVRKGLDIMKAENHRPRRLMISSSTSIAGARRGRSSSSSTAGLKRSFSQTGAPLPPSKRSCSTSPTKAGSNALPNRVHRRVILRDYGKPIYRAGSRAALLAALEGCIEGHESLRKAGFLHRDISINNLMMNEDEENPSWPSFLIDLDLGIRETRREASGAKGKTGTRAFMAIGALLGEQHSFMHDLESMFWVLFWICIHYDGPNQERVVPQFDQWNYMNTEQLATLKLGTVTKESIFINIITNYFTSYFEPLIPWVNRLRRVVFPRGGPQEQEDERLYPRMRGILREACEDLT